MEGVQCGQLQIIGAVSRVDVTRVVAGRKSQCTFSRGNGSAGALERSGWKGGLTFLWDLLYRSQWTRVAVVDVDVDVDVVVIDMAR